MSKKPKCVAQMPDQGWKIISICFGNRRKKMSLSIEWMRCKPVRRRDAHTPFKRYAYDPKATTLDKQLPWQSTKDRLPRMASTSKLLD
jgi:hypothetical protein